MEGCVIPPRAGPMSGRASLRVANRVQWQDAVMAVEGMRWQFQLVVPE